MLRDVIMRPFNAVPESNPILLIHDILCTVLPIHGVDVGRRAAAPLRSAERHRPAGTSIRQLTQSRSVKVSQELVQKRTYGLTDAHLPSRATPPVLVPSPAF